MVTPLLQADSIEEMVLIAGEYGLAQCDAAEMTVDQFTAWLREHVVVDPMAHTCEACGCVPWFEVSPHFGTDLFVLACPTAKLGADLVELPADVLDRAHVVANDPGLLLWEPVLRGYRRLRG